MGKRRACAVPTFPLLDLAMMVGTLALCPPYKFPIPFFQKLNSRHAFTTPPRDAPEALLEFSAQRGRGERRMPVAPAASCALGSGRTHTSNNEYPGITRRSRTQWF